MVNMSSIHKTPNDPNIKFLKSVSFSTTYAIADKVETNDNFLDITKSVNGKG